MKRKNQEYIDHEILQKKACSLLKKSNAVKSSGLKVVSLDETSRILIQEDDGPFRSVRVKGSTGYEGKCIYIEYWNNKHPPIYSNNTSYWFAYWMGDKVFLCKWKELKEYMEGKMFETRASATSEGYLVPIVSIPNLKIFE